MFYFFVLQFLWCFQTAWGLVLLLRRSFQLRMGTFSCWLPFLDSWSGSTSMITRLSHTLTVLTFFIDVIVWFSGSINSVVMLDISLITPIRLYRLTLTKCLLILNRCSSTSLCPFFSSWPLINFISTRICSRNNWLSTLRCLHQLILTLPMWWLCKMFLPLINPLSLLPTHLLPSRLSLLATLPALSTLPTGSTWLNLLTPFILTFNIRINLTLLHM